ncbi:hypothetical protein NEMIN01_1552 [Nematocida minor]|uniref:uncharacterized protein n=1 Tax=Nematocida minor TaxID=1912983 RepID=UPI00221F3B6D|nr:uncharacterized protein NEMIN01_1552 [Nematocida minor]KAI5191526.1 hypothetical protein NEMIN01_1552 [Nematocida minor]
MNTSDANHSMSIYDTIEHDMRHSKEYLANMKFNYIEVLHKSIFLKRLRGQKEEEEATSQKEELVETKKRIEELRKRFEKISQEVIQLREQAERQENALRATREKEIVMKKRIDEISNTEKTLKKFTEIKREHEFRVEKIRQIKQKIEETENEISAKKQTVNTKLSAKESLMSQKTFLQERLKDLQKTANQQLVYQYNWYKQFISVFYKLVGIRVIDVRQSIHKHQEAVYTSIENGKKEKKENTNEISIKLLSKQKEKTVVITLVFVDGKIHGHTIHKTEGTSQIEPISCSSLFNYCKKVNSTKYFIFESIYQQLSHRE